MEKEFREVDILRLVIDAISSEADIAALADRVAEVVIASVEADVCFVHLLREEGRYIELIGATKPYSSERGRVKLAIGDGVSGWVAQAKVPLIVPNKWEDSRYRYLPELGGENYKFLISVPMLSRNSTAIGVLNVHWADDPSNVEQLLEDLVYVANIIAPRLESAAILDRLKHREAQLERFAAATIDSIEAERKRIANDIHDGVGQLLHSTLYRLDAARYSFDISESLVEIDQAKALVEAAIAETKSTIRRLRPEVLDDLGLIAALKSLAAAVNSPQVDVNLPNDYAIELPSTVETSIYRIAQEALSNVQRHSNAQFATLNLAVLEGPREITLTITDDGEGFDEDSVTKGLGLDGMRERAELIDASIEIYSRKNHGTRITLRIPF
ncbi:MAG: histidine kinase [Actinomycetota bacterium]|nr:histidine kinase [Actinomycetota bacterium]